VTSKLKLYSRQYCHLCQDMLAALDVLRGELAREFPFEVVVVDVDADPTLLAKYDELVPVLAADDRELCHYFLDALKVREYLGHVRP